MDTFKNINENLVYTKAKSKKEALSLKGKAKKTAGGGKSVAIFFNNRYYLLLAPGQDPYQVRRDIDVFLNPTENKPKSKPKSETKSKSKSKPETESTPKNIPTRDSSGKFVSKKQSVLESDSSTSTEPPKKKGIFGF